MAPGGGPAQAFEELIAEAVGEALDRRFRAMVVTAVTVALITSLAVSLTFTLLENAATDHAAIQRSRHNCQLVTQIAEIMGSGNQRDRALRRGGFLSTDAYLHRRQSLNTAKIAQLRPGPLKRLLADPETLRLSARSAALDRSTTRYWTNVLIPRLLSAARGECFFS
jgi:hypothetical protein